MADNAGVIKKVQVVQIVPSRYQVRKDFSKEYINRLSVSITKDKLKNPIAVRRIPAPNPLPEGASPGDEFFEILDGQCRWLAHKAAGLAEIEVIEYDIKTEDEAREWVLIANVQRKDLNPIEEAEGYALLIQFDKDKYTHEVIAEKFGKDRSYVTLSLQLLKLSENVKDNVSRGTLSRSHGLQLVRLPSADLQEKAMKEIQRS